MRYAVIILLLIFFTGCANEEHIAIKLNPAKTYLIFRNSETKAGFFIKNFNLYKSNVTHVGILVNRCGVWKIYHALDVKNENCIKVSTIENFCSDLKEKNQLKLLEIEGFDQKEGLIRKLDSVKLRNLKFDFTFSASDANSTYCSKLVCDILTSLNKKRFVFQAKKKKLTNLEAAYLKKDTLVYFPVDLFFGNANFIDVK